MANRVLRLCIICYIIFAPANAFTELKEPPKLRLGIITLWHPLVMYEKYQPFADYLTEKTPFTFVLHIRQNYAEILEGLRTGRVQTALLGGMTYIKAKRDLNIHPLLSALNQNGTPHHRGIFIARSDNSRINAIEDIRGMRFAFASRTSTSGSLMPLFWLRSQYDLALSDLKIHAHFNYHDSVVRAVLRGNYAAGVVLDTIARHYKEAGLKFIGETDPFPGFVLVVGGDMADQAVEAIRGALLYLSSDNPDHRKIMDSWDINIRFGFVPAADSNYNTIREAAAYLSEHGSW